MARSKTAAREGVTFDLELPDLKLERGGVVRSHRARGWWLGPEGDSPTAPKSGVPTVLLVHALTGSAVAGGKDGWWEPAIGVGRALDPAKVRIVCLNNLGSCYGSSGPGEAGFPEDRDTAVTTVDAARAQILALDKLGIAKVHLATGGSLGGMIVLALGALDPGRFERLMPIACTAASSSWVIGWNHVAREVLRLDSGYPDKVTRGLEIARQIAMLTYRAEPGLDARQHRQLPPEPGFEGYRIHSYLTRQGELLRGRFNARSYEILLGMMDSHDLLRPFPGESVPAVSLIRAPTLVVDIDSDQLFTPAQSDDLARRLSRNGVSVQRATIQSAYGHDAFLIEWAPLERLLLSALSLPSGR
jgi:homoserine O-acetyltransferase